MKLYNSKPDAAVRPHTGDPEQRVAEIWAAIEKSDCGKVEKRVLKMLGQKYVLRLPAFNESLFLKNIDGFRFVYDKEAEALGLYYFRNNILKVKSLSKENIGTLTHEGLHFASADRTNIVENNIDEYGHIAVRNGLSFDMLDPFIDDDPEFSKYNGINEGMTAYQDLKVNRYGDCYSFLMHCAYILNDMITDGDLERVYFNGGILRPAEKSGDSKTFFKILRDLDDFHAGEMVAKTKDIVDVSAACVVDIQGLVFDLFERRAEEHLSAGTAEVAVRHLSEIEDLFFTKENIKHKNIREYSWENGIKGKEVPKDQKTIKGRVAKKIDRKELDAFSHRIAVLKTRLHRQTEGLAPRLV